jgi:hypothetical protein
MVQWGQLRVRNIQPPCSSARPARTPLREVILSGSRECGRSRRIPRQLMSAHCRNGPSTSFPFEHRTFELERDRCSRPPARPCGLPRESGAGCLAPLGSTPGLVPRPCAQDDSGLAISNRIVTAVGLNGNRTSLRDGISGWENRGLKPHGYNRFSLRERHRHMRHGS